MADTEKIRIRMEAYDHRALDSSAKEIVEQARRTNAKVSGPVPLPRPTDPIGRTACGSRVGRWFDRPASWRLAVQGAIG